jgi:RHS repeat-associated protein
VADAGLYHNGGTFSNVVISGNLSDGSGATTTINWLVSDHLGTPRIILDQTGSLANLKRHDYLPFGEELFTGTGGRSPAQGYLPSDSVRQQFTGKERDNETDLDYFLARHYSNVQGRFTSSDEFQGGVYEFWLLGDPSAGEKQALPYGDINFPQSLNKYQYCYNNPFKYVDPDGHDALYVVNKDTGETTVVIPVHFTGANATPELIAAIINRAAQLDTGDPKVKIQIVSTDKPIHGVLNTLDLSQGLDFKNYWAGEGVDKIGGNKGHINTNGVGSGGAATHDSLHFAGIKDRYDEKTRDPKRGRTARTPQKGYENNIMATSGGTKLTPKQIEEARKNGSTKKCTVENGITKCK